MAGGVNTPKTQSAQSASAQSAVSTKHWVKPQPTPSVATIKRKTSAARGATAEEPRGPGGTARVSRPAGPPKTPSIDSEFGTQ